MIFQVALVWCSEPVVLSVEIMMESAFVHLHLVLVALFCGKFSPVSHFYLKWRKVTKLT